MQICSIQLKLEQERKSLKTQVYDLERKLEVFRQELNAAESTLSVKDPKLTALKNNLKELEELREMKEVLILLFHLFSLLLLITNIGLNLLVLNLKGKTFHKFLFALFRTLIERTNKQLLY